MKMLVGLGNPGRRYKGTRHNVGFRLVDRIAAEQGVKMRRKRFRPYWSASCGIAGETVHLIEPRTYMNRSGNAVKSLMDRNGLDIADLIVVYDDVALEVGQLRLRQKGSAGGHNGLQSVIGMLGIDEFLRIRIGVGRPPDKGGMVDHVLGGFTKAEEKSIEEAMERGLDMLDCLLREGAEEAMSKFNTKVN